MPSVISEQPLLLTTATKEVFTGVEGGKWLWFNAGEEKPQAASFTAVTQASHISDTALNSHGNVSQLLMTSVEVKAER